MISCSADEAKDMIFTSRNSSNMPSMDTYELDEIIEKWCEKFAKLPLHQKVDALNSARLAIHKVSPFNKEPVDCVRWVHTENIVANDYNPNTVAPPEMQLLRLSIQSDGYTQPIVSWLRDGIFEVVDGFHRNRVGRECPEVRDRIHGYLPLAVINDERNDRGSRIAATIRHNRARGKHAVSSMSDIVVELKRRNWSDEKVSKELGMDPDEILRLCQITGLAELFSDSKFSTAWDIEGNISESDIAQLTDDISEYGEETEEFRTVNTSDENRIFHTFDKWECYRAGFYATTKEGGNRKHWEHEFGRFLADEKQFEKALKRVVSEWKHSCEHYLTNASMNRLAWLGQASACYAKGIPAVYRGGWDLMTKQEQDRANKLALKYLNKWLKKNGHKTVTESEAAPDREMDIY